MKMKSALQLHLIPVDCISFPLLCWIIYLQQKDNQRHITQKRIAIHMIYLCRGKRVVSKVTTVFSLVCWSIGSSPCQPVKRNNTRAKENRNRDYLPPWSWKDMLVLFIPMPLYNFPSMWLQSNCNTSKLKKIIPQLKWQVSWTNISSINQFSLLLYIRRENGFERS